MKDFNINFSFKNLFRETQKEVATLQVFIKTHILTGSGGYFATGSKIALGIGIIGVILDFILHLVYLEEKKDGNA